MVFSILARPVALTVTTRSWLPVGEARHTVNTVWLAPTPVGWKLIVVVPLSIPERQPADIQHAADPTDAGRPQARPEQVLRLDSGKVTGEDFAGYAAAETFRRSMEDSVLERVTALHLSDEMRDDIRDKGLPYLVAVGNRRAL